MGTVDRNHRYDNSPEATGLRAVFQKQKDAFNGDPYPSLSDRLEALQAVKLMMLEHHGDIADALEEDFGVHPRQLAALVELLLVLNRIKYTTKNLKKWMRPDPRRIDFFPWGLSRGSVVYQPLGVVGNMSPWNIPFLASLAPLVDMLSAGNRVMIKPSEVTPTCSSLLEEMVSEAFPEDHVAVVTGGAAVAEEFARLPWDHLLYTGNPAVGKLVMKAASENLTPVTLELGGKCPLVLDEDNVNERSVKAFIAMKALKNGQACIAPDYVFVPRGRLEAFLSLCRRVMPEMFPCYVESPQCTGIINQRHVDRLVSYLEDAERRGARLVQLYPNDEAVNRAQRKVPFTLVLDVTDDMNVMNNEVFGPIIPVMTYGDLDDVLSYVNTHERPLAVYCYTKDKSIADRILKGTCSGGVCFNAIEEQVMQPSMPFGGVGGSGIGRYSGTEGFKTFSNQRSVYRKGWSPIPADTFYPPYGKKLDRIMRLVFR